MISLRALLALIVFSCAAQAATVEFTDGRIFYSQILGQNDSFVILNINGARVQIPRGMIARVRDDNAANSAPLKAGEIRVLPVTGGPTRVLGDAPPEPIPAVSEQKREREAVNVVNEPVRQSLEVQLPMPADPARLDRLTRAVQSLWDDNARADSGRVLADAGDEGLATLIQVGLYNDSPLIRTRSAELLGQLGGRRVLKYLIEAFYSAAHPTIDPYNVAYVKTLSAQISALTGHDYSFYARRSSFAPGIARDMAQWWRNNYVNMPPQLGEPALESGSPDYNAELTRLRTLSLERRQFAGFNYPTDLVNPQPPPGEIGGYPAPPLIPRDLQIERNVSNSGQVASPKPGPDQPHDMPGRLRQLDYENRVRDAIRTGTYR